MLEDKFAYLMYVILYPLEDFSLVQQTSIMSAIFFHFLTCKKAEETNTIVESDNHQVILSSSNHTTSICVCIRIRIETPALKPNDNGVRFRLIDWSKDIEKKTVLILARQDSA